MQNVLFVVNYTDANEGSFIRAITALGKELERNGSKAVYLLPEKSKNFDWAEKMISGGNSVYFFKDSFAGFFKTVRTIKRIIKNFRIGIIHSFFITPRLKLAVSFAGCGNKKLEHIIQMNQPSSGNPVFKEKLADMLHEPALYIAESETVKNSIMIQGKRSVKVMNSVDFSRLEAVDSEIKRSDITDNENQKILFAFGQDINDKGIDTLIETIKEYDKDGRFILMIVVKDIKKAEEEIRSIFSQVPDFVRLMPERNDIATYFNLADIYILLRYTQGSPYTMIESAYLGLPIIYCDDENKNELNIPWSVNISYADKKALYEAVCGIVNEEEAEAYQMSREAREYVVNNFSLGSWVYEIINTYKNIYRI